MGPSPCALHMALDHHSQKQMTCFKKSYLSRAKKLERAAFRCSDLQRKESAVIGGDRRRGEMSDATHACPRVCPLFGAAQRIS